MKLKLEYTIGLQDSRFKKLTNEEILDLLAGHPQIPQGLLIFDEGDPYKGHLCRLMISKYELDPE